MEPQHDHEALNHWLRPLGASFKALFYDNLSKKGELLAFNSMFALFFKAILLFPCFLV